jgi:hypothetical protein
MTSKQFIDTFGEKKIDISELTVDQLYKLNYEQELLFANAIKKSEPFSVERANLMKNAYKTIHEIAILRKKIESLPLTFGASNSYIKIIEKIIKKYNKNRDRCLFFEAGIGIGKIISAVANLKNVVAMGCDVYVDKKFIDANLIIYEGSIYDSLLKLDDNSIDIFYWNDVIEHILEDEIELYIKLLSKKMKINGIIINITPNRLTGPHDITARFEPPGTIAKGTHFHEYTFREILELFSKYNIESEYGILGPVKGLFVLCNSAKIIDKVKLALEKIAKYLPYIIRKKIFAASGLSVSILKKNKQL